MKLYQFFLLVSFFIVFNSCTDDEGASFVPDPMYLGVTTSSVYENEAGFEVTINLSKAATSDLTVNFTLDGTAVINTDYSVDFSSSVVIPEGATIATISFLLMDNLAIHEDKTVVFTITDTSDEQIVVNDSDTVTVTILDDESYRYQDGVFVVNKGQVGNTGTITHVSSDFGTISQAIYNAVNSMDLGEGVQSMAFYSDFAYVIVSDADKIVIADRNSFLESQTITTGLDNPRYMTVVGTTGYVTNWGDVANTTDDFIAVIDLTTNVVTSTISVGEGPEQIVFLNDKLYVAHKGANMPNNIITIVDIINDTNSTITVGDSPSELVLSSANHLWVICEGVTPGLGAETGGKLVKVNTSSDTIEETFDFGTTEHPKELAYDGGKLYFDLSGSIYSMNETSSGLPNTPIITSVSNGLAIKEGKLYVTDPTDLMSAGSIKVYDLTDNSEIANLATGVIPGEIYFNY